MTRAIEYIEELQEGEHWEIHVRREDGDVDLLMLERDIRDADLLVLRCGGESWGRFNSLTDALQQALEPIAPEDWTSCAVSR